MVSWRLRRFTVQRAERSTPEQRELQEQDARQSSSEATKNEHMKNSG